MNKLIKSIFYEQIKSKAIPLIFLIFAAIFIIIPIIGVNESLGMSDYILENSTLTFVFQLVFLGLSVGMICCGDMKDKVANYEVLSGHSRIQVYMARFITSVLIGTVLTMVLSFLPVLTGTAVYGWGDRLSFREVIIRQLLYVFPYLRLTAFLVFVSFLVRNKYVMMAIGVILGIGSLLSFTIFSAVSSCVYISVYNLKYLSDYVTWQIYNINSGGVYKYYTGSSAITTELVLGTIGVSLLMVVIYWIAGYALFRKSEMY
ncbi:MAG: hypothetical protein K5776_04305 [Lachnospiraceae bacterium]|nr:hypothetical protein [Lachnospiraceae bacterium]